MLKATGGGGVSDYTSYIYNIVMGQKEVFPSYHYMACHAVIVNGADQPD